MPFPCLAAICLWLALKGWKKHKDRQKELEASLKDDIDKAGEGEVFVSPGAPHREEGEIYPEDYASVMAAGPGAFQPRFVGGGW